MANKKNILYIILIIVFTITFFILMSICFVGFSYVTTMNAYHSTDGRLEDIALDEKMSGPSRIMDTLFLEKDYEEEFDDYWDFARVRRAYIKGRYADDKTDSIKVIEDYINSTTYDKRKEEAVKYLEEITSTK